MPLKFKYLLGAFVIALCLTACEKSPTSGADKIAVSRSTDNAAHAAHEENKMTQPMIPDPYDVQDLETMPNPVPMSSELKKYLVDVTQSMLRVIAKQATLEHEEGFLGEGEYHWPKDPAKPITLKGFDKLRTNHFSVVFERRSEHSIWFEATLGVHPRNYPVGLYWMDLPASFFADFILEKSFVEDRPNHSIKRVSVFQFSLKNSTQPIQLQFESREDVSSLEDKYPKSFHLLKRG